MREQKELLRKVKWDAMIVLDACRVDYFKKHCGECDTVLSIGARTPEWLRRNNDLVNEKKAVIFSGNPILRRENRKHKLGMEMVDVWQDHWGFFTERTVPACHPMSVNAVILEWLREGRLEGKRIIAWYLQPHTPYIGDPPLPMERRVSRWSHYAREAGVPMTRPEKGVRSGNTSWEEIRRAYAGNLKVGWDAALYLVHKLSGKVVITSDHSELLGEDQHFGHEPGWGKKYPQLHEVPWIVLEGGKIAELERVQSADDVMHDRLKALGYE